MPYNGLHMLPNLKILICGVVFGLLLFAVTGAGVVLPDSYTRVGEIPQISRPMMQRMIADEPAQAQFHIMTVMRRSEELERLRELASLEVAFTQPEPDLLKPAIIENTVSEDILAIDEEALAPQPPGATAIGSETAPDPVHVRPTEIRIDILPDDGEPVQVAVLQPPSTDVDLVERAPSLLHVPIPPPRPTVGMSGIHKRILHRKQRVVQAQPYTVTFGQSLFLRPPLVSR